MNVWLIAAVVLVAALLPCLAICVFCQELSGLAAMQVGSAALTAILILLAQGYHRQPFIDLAVTFALVSVVGSLAFARMMERDL